MIIQATVASGYLRKASAVSWAACLAATPRLHSDLDDYDYQDTGKRKFIIHTLGGDPGDPDSGGSGSTNWRLWQSFFRFTIGPTLWPAYHVVAYAALRLYVYYDGSPVDFNLALCRINGTYTTLVPSAWDMSAGYDETAISTTQVAVDGNGRSYIEIPLSPTQLAALGARPAIMDFRLEGADETTAPPADAYIRAYGYANADTTRRPCLVIMTKDRREQIMEALLARLATIVAGATYDTTPKTIAWGPQPLTTMDSTKFPVLAVCGENDSRERELGTNETCNWHFPLVCAVDTNDSADLMWAVNRLVADATYALELDVLTPGPPLALDFIEAMQVERVRSAPEGPLINDRRAFGIIDVLITYHRTVATR